ncbi:MAG: hypothetical protein JXD22_16985, partial [Sedimentisphaerales bacterium]|nr:hypothetical protein [Sedimentisphaerales bacterium]
MSILDHPSLHRAQHHRAADRHQDLVDTRVFAYYGRTTYITAAKTTNINGPKVNTKILEIPIPPASSGALRNFIPAGTDF